MSSADRFKTRERASHPTRVFLYDPATNEKTEDYLDIRSSLSDEFLEARDRAMQEAPQVQAIMDPAARQKAVKDNQLKLRASLIAGWSFKEEFNEANVLDFIREAPQVQEMVIRVADDASRFFGTPSAPSSDGRKKK